jgi:hypothetical protein
LVKSLSVKSFIGEVIVGEVIFGEVTHTRFLSLLDFYNPETIFIFNFESKSIVQVV